MNLNSIEYRGKIEDKTTQTIPRTITIEQESLRLVVERICTQSKYPLLALRLLLHVLTGIDASGRICLSARHLAKVLDVNYDTVTKCLKQLRQMDILQIER